MRLSNKEKLTFFESLQTMLSSGIPMLEAMDSIEEDMPKNQLVVIKSIHKSLEEGMALSSSLENLGDAFDIVTINILKSGEASGNLSDVLLDIVNHIKQENDFNSKIKQALMYPALVFLLFLGILLVILTYVIPRISSVFSKLKVEIPIATKFLIWCSEFFITNWIFILVAVIFFFILLILLVKFKRDFVMKVISSLPFVSKLFMNIDIARLFRSLNVLLSSGVTINEAINLSALVVSNKKVKNNVLLTKNYLLEGKSLSEGFREGASIYGSLTLKILQAGELSGTLDKSVKKLAEDYDNKVAYSLKALTTILEPLMLIIIALFVGGIMLAIIAPIYQMIGNISQR